jgi:hypothetical protein
MCIPEEHDDEEEEDDDGARVDDELHGGEELRVRLEKQAGERQDHQEEPHRAADGVGRDDGRERADHGEQGAHVEVDVRPIHRGYLRSA